MKPTHGDKIESEATHSSNNTTSASKFTPEADAAAFLKRVFDTSVPGGADNEGMSKIVIAALKYLIRAVFDMITMLLIFLLWL